MKHIPFLLFLLAIPLAARAQSITLGTIAKTSYCLGDTMLVPYTATGTFANDNHFFVELAVDPSFSSFISLGNSAGASGVIPVKMQAAWSQYRVRVVSTDPLVVSADNGSDIAVYDIPTPSVISTSSHFRGGSRGIPVLGLIGDEISFIAKVNGTTGLSYAWHYPPEGFLLKSQADSIALSFLTEGSKNVSVAVTSASGCTGQASSSNFRILSCAPQIPKNARIVTGSVAGMEDFVVVKAGGSYCPFGDYNSFATIFVEPGGSVIISDSSRSATIYMKAGGGLSYNGSNQYAAVVLPPGVTIPISSSFVDTFYCSSLTFDYSQVSGGVAEQAQPAAPRISQSGDRLFVSAEDAALSVRVVNVLGNEIASADGRGTIELDLMPLPAGIYFAIAQAVHERTVKRIAVVH